MNQSYLHLCKLMGPSKFYMRIKIMTHRSRTMSTRNVEKPVFSKKINQNPFQTGKTVTKIQCQKNRLLI